MAFSHSWVTSRSVHAYDSPLAVVVDIFPFMCHFISSAFWLSDTSLPRGCISTFWFGVRSDILERGICHSNNGCLNPLPDLLCEALSTQLTTLHFAHAVLYFQTLKKKKVKKEIPASASVFLWSCKVWVLSSEIIFRRRGNHFGGKLWSFSQLSIPWWNMLPHFS